MKIEELINNIQSALGNELPGERSQRSMRATPKKRIHYESNRENAIPAAVLILFYHKNGHNYFILTERTHAVDTHKGQISLPGGSREDGEDLHFTAMRETEEEIGIPVKDINLIGAMSPLYVPVSGFIIHPFVGWLDEEPEYVINVDEVESVFSVSLDDLLDDEKVKQEEWNLYGMPIDVPYFYFHHFKVWGATAMMLSELKDILK